MIEMYIMGVAIDTKTGSPVIILNDVENRRALPIWIGQSEASAIIRILEEIETPRPMTHDLIYNIIKVTSNSIERIEINDINETTYYATIFLKDKDNKKHEIDSRPSDAIALALKSKIPIFVSPNVIANGTISTDIERDEKESQDFKNFVHNIKPSDFKKLINEELKDEKPKEEDN